MSWKKTTSYFLFQTLRYARTWKHFRSYLAYFSRWKKLQQPGCSALGDELPWLNLPALDFLEREVKPDFKIFEYGGGGSTLFFCQRAAMVVTVEDNPEWFEEIGKKVQEKHWRHWTGMLVEPEPAARPEAADPANPFHFSSSHHLRQGWNYEKYARAIDSFPDVYFDLVLVDGRARPSCIREAIPHLKPGGLLIVDNTERPHYLQAFRQQFSAHFDTLSDQMAPIGYSPDFVRTSIFRKK